MAQLVFGPAPAKSVKLALEAVVSHVDGLDFPVSWHFFLLHQGTNPWVVVSVWFLHVFTLILKETKGAKM